MVKRVYSEMCAHCDVCNEDTVQNYGVYIEQIDAHTWIKHNDQYTLQCQKCKSIECTIETFLELSYESVSA